MGEEVQNLASTLTDSFKAVTGALGNAYQSAVNTIGTTLQGLMSDLLPVADGNEPVGAGTPSDPFTTADQQVSTPVNVVYDASGDPTELTETQTVTDDTSVIQATGAVTSVTTVIPENDTTGTATTTLDAAGGTSLVVVANPDGSSTTTTYTDPDGTGTPTGIDQENGDGTSTLTAFDASGNAYSVDFSAPDGSGTAGNETLTAGTNNESETTIALPEISVSFPAIRVTPDGDDPQVYYQYLPLDVLSGSEAAETLTNTYPIQVGQATAWDIPQQFGTGNYPAGTAGSVFVAIDTAGLVANNAAQASALYVNSPLQLTLTTPEGPISAEVFANASIFAAATPTYSTNELNFGNLHVGDTPTLDFTISNTTPAGPLDDTLNVGAVSLADPSSNYAISSMGLSSSSLGDGSSEQVAVTLNAEQQGLDLINLANMTLTSHDSLLSDETLASPFLAVKANIYAYAVPEVGINSGPGTLTQNGNNYTIDLGTRKQGSTITDDTLVGIRNQIPFVTSAQLVTDDILSGSVNTQGASDISVPFDSTFSGFEGPGLFPLFYINPNTSTLGAHTETVIIHTASDDLFSSTPLPDQVVTITYTNQSAQITVPPPPAAAASSDASDFNGDGNSDILLQNVDGTVDTWQMSGASVIASTDIANPGTSWHEAGTGDFNGDGNSDILYQNDDGTVAIWELNGPKVILGATVANPGTSWHVVGTGDFNEDGKSDILFQNNDGTIVIWNMNGASVASSAVAANPGPPWHPVGTGDFFGTGQSDILLQNDDGTIDIWQMNGDTLVNGTVVANPGPTWHAVGTGDFDSDGKSDILFQNNDGSIAIWEMNGTTVTSGVVVANPGPSWHAVSTGDYNGDGKSDILLQNDDGTVEILQMSGTTVTAGTVVANPGTQWQTTGQGSMHFIDGTQSTGSVSGTILADNFVFTTSQQGAHIINGFDPVHDVITLNQAQFGGYAAVQAAETTVNGSTVITLGTNDTLTINGIPPGALAAKNFV